MVNLSLLLISTGASQVDNGELESFINYYWSQSR